MVTKLKRDQDWKFEKQTEYRVVLIMEKYLI